MTMDLFCYSALSPDKAKKILDLIKVQHSELLEEKFLISQPREIGEIQKEIASEYGLDAKSIFLVCYNDKSAVNLSPSVVETLKVALGSNRVVILFENETLR